MSDGSGCDAELLSRIRAMDVPGNLRARALRVKCEHDEVQRFREYVRGNLYVQADELVRPMRSPAEREEMVQRTQHVWNKFKQSLDEFRIDFNRIRSPTSALELLASD